MCDYSLAEIRSRLAVEGETLVVHRFCTGSRGLTSPADLQRYRREPVLDYWTAVDASARRAKVLRESPPAVCVPPGAQLLIHDIPERLQQQLAVGEMEAATFVQLSAEAYHYRDAVRFNNGNTLLLQRLTEGQRVEVLCLSSADNAGIGAELTSTDGRAAEDEEQLRARTRLHSWWRRLRHEPVLAGRSGHG